MIQEKKEEVFGLGMSQPSHNVKDKANKTIGEDRISEMKDEKNRNTKNERQTFAVDLRKKKR